MLTTWRTITGRRRSITRSKKEQLILPRKSVKGRTRNAIICFDNWELKSVAQSYPVIRAQPRDYKYASSLFSSLGFRRPRGDFFSLFLKPEALTLNFNLISLALSRSLSLSLPLRFSRTLSSFVNHSSCKTMASKPLTTEAIALTEKKMDMTLEDIIKMSKSNPSTAKKQRVSNRSQKFLNTGAQAKSSKVQRFMDSRSSMRQGALAQRRSNFQGNQFPLATEAARKAAVAPIRNRAFNRGRVLNVNKPRVRAPPVQRKTTNGSFIVKPQPQVNVAPKQRPQTLDSRFANMKEQRMRVLSQQNNGGRRNGGGLQRQLWGRGRFGN